MVKAVGCNSVSRPKYTPDGYRRCKLCNGLVRKGRRCKCGRKTPEQMERQRLIDLERVRNCRIEGPESICERMPAESGPCRSCGGATTTKDADGRHLCSACAGRAGAEVFGGGLRMLAPKPGRKCADCGASIDHRGAGAKRCEDCARKRKHRHGGGETAERPKRACVDCGADISEANGNAKRCAECALKNLRAADAARRREKRDAARPKAKTCPDCGAEFPIRTPRESQRVRCEACAEERHRRSVEARNRADSERRRALREARTCVDCGESIAGRGPSARRCEECAKKRAAERDRECQRRKREAACAT